MASSVHVYRPASYASRSIMRCRRCRRHRRHVVRHYVWHEPSAACLTCNPKAANWNDMEGYDSAALMAFVKGATDVDAG
jgi:hypothetical protein